MAKNSANPQYRQFCTYTVLKQDVIIVNTIDEIVTRLDSVDIGNAFHDDLGFQDNPNYAQYNGGDESSVRNY